MRVKTVHMPEIMAGHACTCCHHRSGPDHQSAGTMPAATHHLAQHVPDLMADRACTCSHHRSRPDQSTGAMPAATHHLAQRMPELMAERACTCCHHRPRPDHHSTGACQWPLSTLTSRLTNPWGGPSSDAEEERACTQHVGPLFL